MTCARSTSVAGPRGWRALAKGPAWQVVWAADGGGGLRYLAAGQVIDLSGVNTLPLHGRDAQAFLDAHRPHFIEFVPRLSTIDQAPGEHLRGLLFRGTTPDTVGGASDSLHQRWLLACADPAGTGRLHMGGRTLEFRCAEGNPAIVPRADR